MKPALIVLDMQKAFYDINPATTQSLEDAIEYINAAIPLFRKKNLPVISVQHTNVANGLGPGKEGFEVIEKIALLPTDLRIHKTYGNTFTKTTLAEKLQEMGVDTVIITGFCAEYCVLSSARGAKDVDLSPILLRGGLASTSPENIPFVERINEVISLRALETFLS